MWQSNIASEYVAWMMFFFRGNLVGDSPRSLVGGFNWLCFILSPMWNDDHSNHSWLILFQVGWNQQKKLWNGNQTWWNNNMTGWWFGTCVIFPFSWEFHHPNYSLHHFSEGLTGSSTWNRSFSWIPSLGWITAKEAAAKGQVYQGVPSGPLYPLVNVYSLLWKIAIVK